MIINKLIKTTRCIAQGLFFFDSRERSAEWVSSQVVVTWEWTFPKSGCIGTDSHTIWLQCDIGSCHAEYQVPGTYLHGSIHSSVHSFPRFRLQTCGPCLRSHVCPNIPLHSLSPETEEEGESVGHKDRNKESV